MANLEARILLSSATFEQTSSEYSVEFDSDQIITVAGITNEEGEQQLVYALGADPVNADFKFDFDTNVDGLQEIILTNLARDLTIVSSKDGTTLQLDSIHTFGNSLDVSSEGDLNVLGGAVISTRSVDSENHETGTSNASSGSITLSTDQSMDVRGQLYTHVTGTAYTAGDIHLQTSDTANVSDTGPDTREISFNNASLQGGAIQITAEKVNRKFGRQVVGVDTNTVNVSIVNSNFDGSSITVNVNAQDIIGFADGKYKMGGTMLTGGVIDGGLGTLFDSGTLQSGTGSALQWPTVTVFNRDATANLTVDGSTLTADDTITLASDALSESEVEVIQTKPYGGTGGVELAVGYGRAAGVATTRLSNGTEIHAGADISVTSTGTTKAKVNVRTMAPYTKDAVSATEASASPASAKMIAVAYADTDLTVDTQVDQGVTITSTAGNVKVTATGTPQNIPNASTRAYQDGLAGVTVSYGNDVTSIKATVDGTINALGIEHPDHSDEDPSQITLSPQTSAQITENTLPYNPDLDWQRGELLSYEVTNFNGTEPIGGLNSGQDYFVVDLVNDALKLAHIMELDLELPPGADNGTTQSFAVVTPQSFSRVDAVDEILNRFTLPDHGYTQGQEVQYLASAPAPPALLRFLPTETLNDSTFSVDGHGLVTGQEVQYSVTGELPGDGGTSSTVISGLQNQGNYYVIALTQDSFQLAETLEDARNTVSLTLSNSSETATQAFIFDSVQEPAPIGGLFDQQNYYVIRIDDNQFALATTPEDADSAAGIDLQDAGAGGRHAFAAVTSEITFNPFDSNQFDSGTNTFHVDTTGIETGTRLIYDVDAQFSDTQTISRFHTFSPSPTPVEFDPTSQITLPVTVLDLVNNVLILPNHGLSHGDSVTYRAESEGAPPLATVDGDLSSGQTLYVIRVDADRIQLAADISSAALPNPTALVFQVPGEPATYTLTRGTNVVPFDPTSPVVVPVVDPVQNTILFSDPHYLVTGQRVTYSATAGVNTVIGGLANDTDYYVIELSPYEIQLASSAEDALASDALDLTTVGLSSTHSLTASAIDADNDWIVTPHHGLETGQRVIYSSHDGTSAGNLTDGTAYYIVRLDQNRIRLADNPQNATAAVRETNPTVIHYRTLSSPGTGTLHSVESTSIVRSFDATRLTPVVDIGADTLNLSFDWSAGQKVNYQTSGGDPIGGLEDGQDYYVITIADN
ncbi:MAG: hypothetical protein MK102_18550, partial [Fuerstiella sp.]|nr:hypothetical protein [Fuerstiella sp.]